MKNVHQRLKKVLFYYFILTTVVLFAGQYALSADMYSQQAKLTAPDSTANDEFGCSVAIDGDTMLVGARGRLKYSGVEDNRYEGVAYVFGRAAAGWALEEKLALTLEGQEVDDGGMLPNIGYSVAISSNTLILGAPGIGLFLSPIPNSEYWITDHGRTYVFNLNSILSVREVGARVEHNYSGSSVDVDGDTMVVGIPGANDYYGAAAVYVKQANNTWLQVATLSTFQYGSDKFGSSVAIDGDTIVVGAPSATDNKGTAYIFVKPQSGWVDMLPVTYLSASDGAADDQFGCSVAIDGNTVIVGASGDDTTTKAGGFYFRRLNHGSAYVFVKPQSGWQGTHAHIAKLTASDKASNDEFGTSVAISGNRVVVGAQGDDNYKGSTYVFLKPQSGWATMTQNDKLTASDGAASDFFGYSVAIDGDTVVAGAWGHGTTNKGTVYAFKESAQATTTTTASQSSTTTTADGTSTTTTAASSTTTSVGGPCQADAECDNSIYCDGVEKCIFNICTIGLPACTADKSCKEEAQECWDVAAITAKSLSKALSKPLVRADRNRWLIVYCSEDNHFDKQESRIAAAGAGDGYQGVSVNTQKNVFSMGKFIFIPLSISQEATSGNWQIIITTELPGVQIEERIVADFQVR